jgi:glycerophosphoryl diester phosphodiesterase
MTRETAQWLGRRPFNWAHQGGAREAPSNTLYAMRTAIEHGADGLELDVHQTADGHLVVCHDPTLDRTTSGHGSISSQSLAAVQTADSAYWWVPGEIDDHRPTTLPELFVFRGRGPADHDFRVPTLGEVLSAFPTTPLNLELKQDGYEKKVADELAQANRLDVIVVSISGRRLRRFRAVAPNVPTAVGRWYIITFWLLSRIGIARRAPSGVVALEVPDRALHISVCDRRLLKAARRRGLKVFAWTVDDEDRMTRLLHLDVDGIMTNRPSVLARLAGKASSS